MKMIGSDPAQDFWSNGWEDGCLSPSHASLESPCPFLDLPPLSPSSFIDGSPFVPADNGLFARSVPSTDVDNNEDSDETLGNLIASLHGGPPVRSSTNNILWPASEGVLLSPSLSSSSEIIGMERKTLSYRWHDATLHSSVPLSFEDWVSGGPGNFDDDSLLHHLLWGGTRPASQIKVSPTITAMPQTMKKPKIWPKVIEEGDEGPGGLKSLLVNCAEAIEAGDRRTGESLLARIQQCASPLGTSRQRLAHYVSESLATRIAGVNLCLNVADMTSTNADASSLPPLLECFHIFNKFNPHMTIARFVANEIILKTAEGASKIHLLELATLDHQPWTDLITALASRPCPPLLRITCVVLSDIAIFNATVKGMVECVVEKVSEYARSRGVPFEHCLWYGELEGLREETLQRTPDEVFIVNCMYSLHVLMEEAGDQPSQCDRYLQFLQRVCPKIFIQSEVCGAFGAAFFLTRFREALSYFESYFEMLDITCTNEEHSYAASSFLGSILRNALACEGIMRMQRPQKCRQWNQMVEAAGFEQVPIDLLIREKAKAMMRRRHKDLWVGDEDNWLVVGWKGRLAHATTTWRPRANYIPLSHRKKRRILHRTTPKS